MHDRKVVEEEEEDGEKGQRAATVHCPVEPRTFYRIRGTFKLPDVRLTKCP
jgi:hypothetical protein